MAYPLNLYLIGIIPALSYLVYLERETSNGKPEYRFAILGALLWPITSLVLVFLTLFIYHSDSPSPARAKPPRPSRKERR